MDILDILLDILLKPPQPLMGLFFMLVTAVVSCKIIVQVSCLDFFQFQFGLSEQTDLFISFICLYVDYTFLHVS